MTTKVLVVMGTRPEAIKLAPVIRALQQRAGEIEYAVCVTGQHREMLDQVLRLFEIVPEHDLDVMEPDQTLAGLTARLLERLDRLVLETRPDWILAQGDTTSVLAASLVAFYRRLRFGHVEAGLRTGDLQRPFPEEANRRIADLLATAYFAPTERARRTLLAEGVTDGSIWMTGNTVVDALLEIAGREYRWDDGPLAVVPTDARLVLVTAHRRESFGQPFRDLCLAIRDLAVRFADQRLHVVYPVHLNPNVQRPVHELLSGVPNVTLLPPLDYLSLVQLMKRATLILTDSGGIQEEAPTFGVPTLVMRETTERPEAVEVGVARLVGTARKRIVHEATTLLTDPVAQARIRLATNPYGDGRAGERIVKVLLAQTLDH